MNAKFHILLKLLFREPGKRVCRLFRSSKLALMLTLTNVVELHQETNSTVQSRYVQWNA